MIQVALVGCGHWGSNYLRILKLIDGVQVATICDASSAVLNGIQKHHPGIRLATEVDDILDADSLDAVIIATPAHSHYEYTRRFLRAGKHVLVEKPLALSVQECQELCELADTAQRTLMVGHTFLYNPGIRKMKEIITRGVTGDIYYLQSVRTHLGQIREDVNTVWDLAPHDISIFSYLLERRALKVSAVGLSALKPGLEDVAFMSLFYEGNILGHVHISWVDANKSRQVAVIGSRARILFDDLNPLERIRIYEKGVSMKQSYSNFGEFQLLLRDGDILSPKIEPVEPLHNVCLEFLDCIKTGRKPLTDGWNGLEVVETMVAIQQSIKLDGQPVEVGVPKSSSRR